MAVQMQPDQVISTAGAADTNISEITADLRKYVGMVQQLTSSGLRGGVADSLSAKADEVYRLSDGQNARAQEIMAEMSNGGRQVGDETVSASSGVNSITVG